MTNNYIYGIRSVIEALDAGKEPDKIFIQIGVSNPLMHQLKQKLKELDLVYQHVPAEKLNRITNKNHQGAVAFITEVAFHNIDEIIPQIFEKGEEPLIVILDRITDVRNFGAIARTAACAGVHAIVIPSRGAAQINEDAIKTSAGALHKIPVCREHDLKKTVLMLKESGLKIIACTEKTDQHLYAVSYKQPVAIILGSEENGISGEYLKLSDERVRIPMSGMVDSLNVSVSAAIVLYEAVRQRNSLK
ncbi:MAG: 23S rRNA (guanosine(2251)-2'-O)-methyltransferase RlmB [Bacteroidia bacterium]